MNVTRRLCNLVNTHPCMSSSDNNLNDGNPGSTQEMTESGRPGPKYTSGQTMVVSGSSRPDTGKVVSLYGVPQWSDWTEHPPQWLYNYDYGLGGTSEGVALECHLRPAPPNSYV